MIFSVEIPVAVGELIDKITILEIKLEELSDGTKLDNVRREFDLLVSRRAREIPHSELLDTLTAQLKKVNRRLWDLEDVIRASDRDNDFGERFIATARSIYRTNDLRAGLKREINLAVGSAIIEEKSYAAERLGIEEPAPQHAAASTPARSG